MLALALDRAMHSRIGHSGTQNVLFWMNFPFETSRQVKSTHLEDLIPYLMQDFLRYIYVQGYQVSLQSIHENFVSSLCLSFISNRAAVIETDFTHKRNMVLKYIIHPFRDESVSKQRISTNSDLFLSSRVEQSLEAGSRFGYSPTLEEIISGDHKAIGLAVNRGYNSDSLKGYFYFASRAGGYESLYLLPTQSIIHCTNEISSSMGELAGVADIILAREGAARVTINRQKSLMRHTIAVQIEHLKKSFSSMFQHRTRVVQDFHGDRDRLNIDISEMNDAIYTLDRDISRQFKSDFDVYGERVSPASRRSGGDSREIRLLDLVTLMRREFEASGPPKDRILRIFARSKASVTVSDLEKLSTALREFFANAIKYGPKGDEILVTAERDGEEVAIQINNLGPELSESEEQRIPMMGLRGLGAQKLTSAGTGQGLASAFALLDDLGIERDYYQTPLRRDQRARTKGIKGPLAMHTIELRLPLATVGAIDS
jgi:anti-sigma regulatory factor (Ser/Thr protein kinase)